MSTTNTTSARKPLPFETWSEDGFYSAHRTLADAQKTCDRLTSNGVQSYVYRAADMETVYDPCEGA